MKQDASCRQSGTSGGHVHRPDTSLAPSSLSHPAGSPQSPSQSWCPIWWLYLLTSGLFNDPGEDATLKMPSIQCLTWCCSAGALFALTVLPPFGVKRAPLLTRGFPIDEHEFGVRFSVLFDHRDELPSFPDSAILFKVRFAALTIHFLSTPPANGNSSEVDSKMDSKPQAIR